MTDTPEWMREPLHPHYAQSFTVDRLLYDSETDHQRLRVFENGTFGRILTLDDVIQTTEGDNFIYHEMLTHVPILAHGAARRVCIVGGADGADFMRSTDGGFDVIIVDSTDPIGPGEVLFTDTFYGHAKRALTPGGILVTQNGVPFMQGAELTNSLRAFQALFSDAWCYMATVPTYAGGPMAFGWATDGAARDVSLSDIQTRFSAAGLTPEYYTPEVHKAAFALPGYVLKLFP
jgi:spermidine synthase